MIDLAQTQIVAAAFGLALLWILESIIPFVTNRKGRLRHFVRNIFVALLNAVILTFLFVPVLVYLTSWAAENNFGLLNQADLPWFLSATLAILFLDGWMYLWHRANHRIPFLWRFHKVHHSDPEMDASTAVRFHSGEILISAFLRLGVIAVLGLSFAQVLLYDLLLIPVIFLHHSNIRFPERLDKSYRSVFASPLMHRIHHAPERIETDSNYGSIFSFWDRFARSFRLRDPDARVAYGLSEFIGEKTEDLFILALMPFRKPKL